MIKAKITEREYQAVYRLLDRVSSVPFDCGTLCNYVCCGNFDDLLEKNEKNKEEDAECFVTEPEKGIDDFEGIEFEMTFLPG